MTEKQKVAIVTGAGGAIGKAIAAGLAKKGANLVVSDIDADAAQETAAFLQSTLGCQGVALRTDIKEKEDIDALTKKAMTTFGRLDFLVNCAGVMFPAAIEEITPQQWDDVMAINLKGVFLTCQSVTPILKRQRAGAILNLGSVAAKVGGLASGAHYATSKAGVHCLTIIFARELAPFGVRVNALAPGPVDTQMLDAFSSDTKQNLAANCPLGRLASVDDIAEAATFLLSDAARHITGEILDLNGGILMD